MQINKGMYRSGFTILQGTCERAQADLLSGQDSVESGTLWLIRSTW